MQCTFSESQTRDTAFAGICPRDGIAELKEELERKTALIAEREAHIERMAETLYRQQEELRESQVKLEKLDAKCVAQQSALDDGIARFRSEVERLDTEYYTLQSSNKELLEQYRKLQQKHSETETKMRGLSDENNRLSRLRDGIDAAFVPQLEQLQAEVRSLTEQNIALQNYIKTQDAFKAGI